MGRYTNKTYSYPAMLGKVMYAIKDDPVLLSLVLGDEELHRWWTQRKHKEIKRIEKEEAKKKELEEQARLEIIRNDVLSRLTEDEKAALGLLKPLVKNPATSWKDAMLYEYDNIDDMEY